MFEASMKAGEITGIKVLTLSGEFDISNKKKMIDILPLIAQKGCKGLVIDLTGVSFIDSGAVEVLIMYQHALSALDTHVVLVVDHEGRVERKLKMLRLFDGTGIGLAETVEDAIKRFG